MIILPPETGQSSILILKGNNHQEELEKSQSSLHKAFYNGGVVDLHQEYPHDSAVLLSDGTTKYLAQDTGAVQTVVLKDKSVKICKRCIRRLVAIRLNIQSLFQRKRDFTTESFVLLIAGKKWRIKRQHHLHGDMIIQEWIDFFLYFCHFFF